MSHAAATVLPSPSCLTPSRITRLERCGPSWSPVAPARGSVGPKQYEQLGDAAGPRSVGRHVAASGQRRRGRGGARRRRRSRVGRASMGTGGRRRRLAQRVGACRAGRGRRRRHHRLRARRGPAVRRRQRSSRRCIAAVAAGADGAMPGVPVTDTIKLVDDDGRRRDHTAARSRWSRCRPRRRSGRRCCAPRTPPVAEGTDDAALVEAAGGRVVVVAGEADNRKITDPDDLHWARARRPDAGRRATMNVRVGQGFDIHRFSDDPTRRARARRCRVRRRARPARPQRRRRRRPRRRRRAARRRGSGRHRRSTSPTPIRSGRAPTRSMLLRHGGAVVRSDGWTHRQRRLLGGVRDAEAGAAPRRDAAAAQRRGRRARHREGSARRRTRRPRAAARASPAGRWP